MTGYSVYLPKQKGFAALEKVDRLVFVKEGFAWFAVLSPLLWALYHRLWTVALGILGIMLLLNGMVSLMGLGSVQQIIFTLILNVAFAIEATRIRKWVLEQQHGYRFEGFVTGQDETDCQRRFLQNWLPSREERPEA